MRIYDRTGQTQGTWTIIKQLPVDRKKLYLLRCECGNEKTVDSGHITRIIACQACKPQRDHNAHKGEKSGHLTCLGYAKVKKGHGYLIQCDCGKIYTLDNYAQFKKTTSCLKCRMGFHPGKRVGHCTLLENIGNRRWKKKCDCGNIFISAARKSDCGCVYKHKLLSEAQKKIGLKYHFLTVKKIVGQENGHIQLLVKCKCGKEFIRDNGHEFKSKSCGCELSVPVGDKASNATLKNAEVLSIRELYTSGMYPIDQLAKMFGKGHCYIWRIIHRKIWKHI